MRHSAASNRNETLANASAEPETYDTIMRLACGEGHRVVELNLRSTTTLCCRCRYRWQLPTRRISSRTRRAIYGFCHVRFDRERCLSRERGEDALRERRVRLGDRALQTRAAVAREARARRVA